MHSSNGESCRVTKDPNSHNSPRRVVIFSAGAVSTGLFYDFIKYALGEAVGQFDDAEQRSKSLRERIEPTIGELGAALESPLDEVHRPIRKEPEIELDVARPRGEVLAKFDSKTALQLMPRTVPAPHPIVGNVTRYNTLTGWGRFYDREEERPISFFVDTDLSDYQRSLVTWSLHEANIGNRGTLYLGADAIVSPTDKIKRYNVSRISNTPI